jgi:predicted RNA methylase
VSKLSISLDQQPYSDYSDNRDDELFRSEILSRIRPGDTILDLGAGAEIVRQMNFRSLAGRVCGIDADERVKVNPFLNEGKVGLGALQYFRILLIACLRKRCV